MCQLRAKEEQQADRAVLLTYESHPVGIRPARDADSARHYSAAQGHCTWTLEVPADGKVAIVRGSPRQFEAAHGLS